MEQTYVRSQITFERAWLLLTFAKRSAVCAARTRNPGLVKDSLTALAIENLACEDVRDDLVALGLIFHCAKSIHSEPAIWFQEVAQISGPAVAKLLCDFLLRGDLDQILVAMGWQEVKMPNEVGYVWGTRT